jgi:hypothetical protein
LSDAQTKEVVDPYAGLTADGRFLVSETARLPEALTLDRLDRRRSLLEQFDDTRRRHDRDPRTQSYDRHQQMAFSLLTSSKLHAALDIGREPAGLRERYGMTLFGQSCLAARRLVEAGSRFVTVFWDAYEIFAGCAWDTHANHYPRLKEYLLPGMDLAFSALLADLDERGLLDETLVLWISEHGRTPQIDSKPKGAGRHHWSRAYSSLWEAWFLNLRLSPPSRVHLSERPVRHCWRENISFHPVVPRVMDWMDEEASALPTLLPGERCNSSRTLSSLASWTQVCLGLECRAFIRWARPRSNLL